MEHDEFSVASLYDFYQDDADSDGTLNQEESIGEFPLLRTVRSALE